MPIPAISSTTGQSRPSMRLTAFVPLRRRRVGQGACLRRPGGTLIAILTSVLPARSRSSETLF
jgi:hypothetical protein